MNKFRITRFIFISLLVLLFTSCNENDPGPSRVSFILTDAPAEYDAVYVDIQNVLINKSENEEDENWDSLDVKHTGVFNLLELNNGADTLLGTIEFGGGRVSQIRLVLGNENSLVVNGETFPLTTPSAQQSGLKLNVNANFIEGIEYQLWLDFDAAKSIVKTGSDKYILKPVVRVFSLATTGIIEGYVLPAEAKATVYAIINGDSVAAIPEANGKYAIVGLVPGQYTVLFDATDPYADFTNEGVIVNRGVITSLDTVRLEIP